jgi:hypothetical protein
LWKRNTNQKQYMFHASVFVRVGALGRMEITSRVLLMFLANWVGTGFMHLQGTKIIGASKPWLTPRRCTPPAQQAWATCPDEVELECTHIRPSRCWMRSGHYAAGWRDSLISKVYNRSRWGHST